MSVPIGLIGALTATTVDRARPLLHRGQVQQRLALVAQLAAETDGVVTAAQLDRLGVPRSTRSRWVQSGLLVRLGPRSYAIGGAPATWQQAVRAAAADLAPDGVIAGRTAARLHRLDGFGNADPIELLVPRHRRGTTSRHVVRSTRAGLEPNDVVIREGVAVLSPERLIIEAPLFWFRRRELENAIDSAIRLRLVSEARLRERVERRTGQRVRHHRALVDVLIDTGGESYLERRFLEILRRAGLSRPQLQRVYGDGTRTIARVDARFPGGLVVEVEGHATHSSRRHRQRDEQRRTELMLLGETVIVFTYVDLDERPDWVAATVARALRATGATEFPA